MPEITPLVCSACGSQLKSTSEPDRFICSNCGTAHLVERGASAGITLDESKSKDTGLQLKETVGQFPKPADKNKTRQVLLELLGRVPDADKLDILLEPTNLLRLLLLYGGDEDDLKGQLAGGKIPGELLLELLDREPDPDKLLARLGIPVLPSKKTSVSDSSSNLQARLAGVIFVACGLVFVAVVLISYLMNPNQLHKFQVVLLCSAPILVILGLFQIITRKTLL